MADTPRHPIFDHAESIAKLATVVLGGLYVLGLLISNFQLMEVGISDFASLQARNVLTGFTFLMYVILLCATVAPLAALPLAYRNFSFVSSKTRRFLLAAFACCVATMLMMAVAGSLSGYHYPWGFSWYLWLDPASWLSGLRKTYVQFFQAYWHAKIILVSALAVILSWTLQPLFSDEDPQSVRLVMLGVCVMAVPVPLVLVLFEYADEVYPNFRYNVGGGQPSVAELVLSGKKSDIAGIPGWRLCCEDEKAEQTLKTGEVAVWYQSDKFAYVSSISKVGSTPAQVIALDLKLVRSLRYLPKYIEVRSGSSIEQIYERKDPYTVGPVSPPPAPPAAVFGFAFNPVVWTQLHPDAVDTEGALIARALVPAGSRCPEVGFDGPGGWKDKRWPMVERWGTPDGDFAVKVCEITYPGFLAAKIVGNTLPKRPADPQRIVVFGDTGCRITAKLLQPCRSEAEWPFGKIATAAAKLNPDLVIHVGDYHYREAACPDRDKCGDTPPGDNWATWKEEFFDPAAPLLAKAPWVMLRGNHEDWTRAGSGWQILLSPASRQAGEAPWPDESPPYTLDFNDLTLAILDVANAADLSEASQPVRRSRKYDEWIRRLGTAATTYAASHQKWLLLHSPPWVSFECKKEPCSAFASEDEQKKADADPRNKAVNVVRSRLRQDSPLKFDLMLAGDTHMFQFFVPERKDVPPQIVAGMGGALREPKENYEASLLNKPLTANLFDVAGKLWMNYEFGFLLLSKEGDAWAATLHGMDGKELVRCDLKRAALDAAQMEFPCKAVTAH